MSAGFTPGPWYCERRHTVFTIETATKSLANVSHQGSAGRDGTAEANAHLIAAAPALHKAADLLASFDATGDEAFLRDAIRAAREALAIVRGDQ